MRIFFIILAMLAMRFSALSQTISYTGKNVPLTVIFSAIEKQTSYVVIYSYAILKKAKPVSVSAKNQPLTDFLETILKGQPFEYIIREKNISIREKASSLTADLKSGVNGPDTSHLINIRGRIVNEKGDPVVATITIKGNKNAVSSNANGEFIVRQVENNSMLAISGVNIEPYEIKINGNADLKTITVKTKIKEEEEVVIANTGYQKVKPNEITGSVSVIDNKTLNQQTGTNIIDRLNGVTPGMLFNVGKFGTVDNPNPNPYSIRGLSTIEGNTSPLIILDNFPYDGDINNINPGDVDNITILKDAAAASIYGARGGNGVIVITTKRGRFNQKLKVEFNTNLRITQKPDLYAIPQLSSAEYIYLEEFFFKSGVPLGGSSDYSLKTPVVNILTKKNAGVISAIDSAAQIDALKQVDSRDDLNKYFYQQAITRQYSLNLRGGSNNLAWFLSGSYDKSITNLDGKDDKINVKLSNEYKPVKNLNISFSAYYTNATTEKGKTVFPSAFRNAPYIKYADEEGVPLAVPRQYKREYTDTAGAGHLLSWQFVPLEDYKHDKTTTRREQLVAGVETRYTFLKGLDLSLSYQYQREWGSLERYADIESYYARSTINSFTKLSRTIDPDTFYVPKGGILGVATTSENSYNLRAQLNFQKEWRDRRHAVNAIIAAERREAVTNPDNNYTLYGYNKDPLTQGKVNYNDPYSDFITGGSIYIPGAPIVGSTRTSHFVSFLGNATYIFKQRYSISASARKDAANVFGLSTNDKWTPLWSAGIAWDMGAENFYHFKLLPRLKWKFTYGYSGNVDISKTANTVLTYYFDDTPFGTPGADATRKNARLRWEKKQDFNIAMEFATKGNTISGILEYYQKKCTDLYGQTFYDYTTYGLIATIPANVANTKGNGFDITVTSRNLDQAVKWNTTFIFNYSSDIVTKYFAPFNAESGGGLVTLSGNNIFPVIGKPLYAIAAYKWGGLNSAGNPQGYYQGKLYTDYLGIQGDVQINGLNSQSVSYMGPSNPPFFGSLINEVSWKGFSVNINLLYSFGYYFRKPVFSQTAWVKDGTGYGEFSKRWQKPGDELITNVPALLSPLAAGIDSRNDFYQYSSVNVLKADHVRLHYINLSYSFTRKQQRLPFSFVQVYFNMANLGIVWRANKEKIDPLYPNSIPPSKSFTLGLRASL